MSLLEVVQCLTLLGVLILIILVRFFVPAYVKKKAENLAQKEDLEDLTHIVEGVRTQFERATLVHRVQFEAEFKYYEKVWDAARAVETEFVRLNPVADETLIPRPNQERFDEFQTAQLKFADTLDSSKPFIPEEVFEAFTKLDEFMIEEKFRAMKGIAPEDIRKYRQEGREHFAKCVASIKKRLSGLIAV